MRTMTVIHKGSANSYVSENKVFEWDPDLEEANLKI